jgi:hypothetical protein
MLLVCPLAIPKIVPNDWDEWWSTWNTAEIMTKVTTNHNGLALKWRGLDLYKVLSDSTLSNYRAPYAEQNSVVLDLCKQVQDSVNFKITLIRVIENLEPISPHSDNFSNTPSIRTFLWNTYKQPVWNFANDSTSYSLTMPDDTNSFYYLDGPIKHSAIYDPNCSKGVLAVYGVPNSNFETLLNNSYLKYQNYAWDTQPISSK